MDSLMIFINMIGEDQKVFLNKVFINMQFTKVSNVIGASLLAGTLSLGAAVIPAHRPLWGHHHLLRGPQLCAVAWWVTTTCSEDLYLHALLRWTLTTKVSAFYILQYTQADNAAALTCTYCPKVHDTEAIKDMLSLLGWVQLKLCQRRARRPVSIPHTLTHLADDQGQVLSLLLGTAEGEEECRNVVAECLGRLALLSPDKVRTNVLHEWLWWWLGF